MAALLQYSPVPGGRGGSTLVAQNPPPICHAFNRKSRSPSSSSSSQLAPVLTGLHLQKGTRGFVVRRRPLPPVLCFFGNGGAGSGSGSRRDDTTGVEDEDADIEELLMRSRGKLVVDVRPLHETTMEEEEAVRKGSEMLCEQFRLHLGLTHQELRERWLTGQGGGDGGGGGAEERLRLVRDFLEGEWGCRYHPLSPRAAVEMLDEHMGCPEGRVAAAAAGRSAPSAGSAATAARPRRLLRNWWR